MADKSVELRSFEGVVELFLEGVYQLAKGTDKEYQQQRDKKAKEFNIDVTKLDALVQLLRIDNRRIEELDKKAEEYSPWPDPVDGSELLKSMVNTLNEYVVLPPKAAEAISLWVLFAHCHDAFEISPLLNYTSPEKRCGKSRGLGVTGKLLNNPVVTANISPAALYTKISDGHRPVLMDEVDRFLNTNESLIGDLNAAWIRGTSDVERVTWENNKRGTETLSLWAPKIIAGIGERTDTLEDRSITIEMTRKLTTVKVKKFSDRPKKIPDLVELRRKAIRWAEDNIDNLRDLDPDAPELLNDRQADNWGPLLAIAECIGGEWPRLARQTALIVEKVGEPKAEVTISLNLRLLVDCYYAFEHYKEGELTADVIINHIVTLPERPWVDKYGKPITSHAFAKKLKMYKIYSHKGRSNNTWHKDDFWQPWLHYGPEAGLIVAHPHSTPPLEISSTSPISSTSSTNGAKRADLATKPGGIPNRSSTSSTVKTSSVPPELDVTVLNAGSPKTVAPVTGSTKGDDYPSSKADSTMSWDEDIGSYSFFRAKDERNAKSIPEEHRHLFDNYIGKYKVIIKDKDGVFKYSEWDGKTYQHPTMPDDHVKLILKYGLRYVDHTGETDHIITEEMNKRHTNGLYYEGELL